MLQSQCPSPPSSFVAANTPLISKPVVEPSNMAVVLPLYIVLPLIATCVSSSAGVYTLLVSAFVACSLIVDLYSVID